jgi:hypothetical protein
MDNTTNSKMDPLHSDTMYVMGVALSLALPVLALMVWPSAKSSAYMTHGPAAAVTSSAEQAPAPTAVVADAQTAEAGAGSRATK